MISEDDLVTGNIICMWPRHRSEMFRHKGLIINCHREIYISRYTGDEHEKWTLEVFLLRTSTIEKWNVLSRNFNDYEIVAYGDDNPKP